MHLACKYCDKNLLSGEHGKDCHIDDLKVVIEKQQKQLEPLIEMERQVYGMLGMAQREGNIQLAEQAYSILNGRSDGYDNYLKRHYEDVTIIAAAYALLCTRSTYLEDVTWQQKVGRLLTALKVDEDHDWPLMSTEEFLQRVKEEYDSLPS